MKLGIDLDGVVFPFAENFKQYCLTRPRSVNVPVDATVETWDFFRDWGMTVEEFVAICDEGVDDGYIFYEAEPIPGSVETLQALHRQGHTIHVITHRMFGSKSFANTHDWLVDYKVPFTSVTFAKDKTFAAMDVLLDDRVENYEASVRAGIPALVFDQPWNRHLEDAERVRGWSDFYDWVQENG